MWCGVIFTNSKLTWCGDVICSLAWLAYKNTTIQLYDEESTSFVVIVSDVKLSAEDEDVNIVEVCRRLKCCLNNISNGGLVRGCNVEIKWYESRFEML